MPIFYSHRTASNGNPQVPTMPGNWGLIDIHTPQSAYTMPSYVDGSEWQLVFSDEFDVDGRTFYPGDDPYWEAVDLHYWQVSNTATSSKSKSYPLVFRQATWSGTILLPSPPETGLLKSRSLPIPST